MSTKAVALGDFAGEPAQHQTSFKKGESITILKKIQGGWWYGVRDSTGEKGYFPESYVKEYDPEALQEAQKGKKKWKSAFDKRYGRNFYVNLENGETTWTRPEDFDGEEEMSENVDDVSDESIHEESEEDEEVSEFRGDIEELTSSPKRTETFRRSVLVRENKQMYSARKEKGGNFESETTKCAREGAERP